MRYDRSLILLVAGAACYGLGAYGPPGLPQVICLALAMGGLAASARVASNVGIRAFALCLMVVSAVLLTMHLYAHFVFRNPPVGW